MLRTTRGATRGLLATSGLLIAALTGALYAAGCAGSSQPVAAPSPPQPTDDPAPSATPPPEEPAEPVAAPPQPPPEPPEQEAEPISKPSRPASEIMLETDTDFLFDYGASAPKAAAEAECTAGEEVPSSEDKAACLQKARDKFVADVLTFRRVGETKNARLIIYQRRGNSLSEVFSGPVTLEDAGDTSVKVTVQGKGKGKGYRTLFATQKEFNASVPDDYTLILEDPRFGKLLYRAKIGLVTR